MDGSVIIGTKLDTKDLEKQLRDEESELEKYKNESEKLTTLKGKLEIDSKKTRNDLEKVDNDLSVIEQKIKNIESVSLPENLVENVDYQKLINQREELNSKGELYLQKLEEIKLKQREVNKKTEDNVKGQERVTEEVKKTKEELSKSVGMDSIKNSIDSTSKSLKGIVSKTIRWGLSLIGVRSAYMGVRQAISLVSSQNEEVGNKIQQMRNVVAGALLPIVQQITDYIAKLMVYINYIFRVLTGRNLFNFADATKKSSKDLSSGAKNSRKIANNLKEARKQLAGFDEMNVLNDNVSSSGGSGAGDETEFGNIFDKLQNIKIPKWIQDLANVLNTLKNYWKELLIVVSAFGSALLALKITDFILSLLKLNGTIATTKAGIGLMVAGVTLLIGSIINLVWNWDNMTKREKVITGMLAGIGLAFVSLGYAIANGISVATLGIGALIGVIIALTTAIGTSIVKEEKEIETIRSVTEQEKLLKEAKARAKQAYDDLINAIDRQTQAQKDLQIAQDETGLSGEELYNQVENGTITYKNMNEEQRRVYKAYKELIDSTQAVEDAEKNKVKTDKESIKQELNKQASAVKTKKDFEKLKDAVVKANKEQGLSAKDSADVLSKALGKMDLEANRTFTKDIPDNIKKGLKPEQYRTTWEKFVDLWNWNISKLTKDININITGKYTTSGGKHASKGAIITYPKLAVGGIINVPGRGVPVGNAIAGEKGAEGVIPLTDSQQMALLGEAIGKFITVNANITNMMNGRVISRELQKIKNESDFAYNR